MAIVVMIFRTVFGVMQAFIDDQHCDRCVLDF